jgi:predicted amidohydrolase
LRIGLAQMNSKTGDIPGNVDVAIDLVAQAAGQGCDLVLLPEFFNMEYFAQYRDIKYLDYAEPIEGGYTIGRLSRAAADLKVWVVATIFEQQWPGLRYDTAVLIDRQGCIKGTYRKAHPAAVYGLEKIYFRFGSHFPVFQIEDWRAGMMICYDTYFPETARILAVRGAELILTPFASPGPHIWRELISVRAFENGCYLAACNKVGPEGDWVFAGGSMVAAPDGQTVSMVKTDGNEVIYADLDHRMVEEWRRRFPMYRDRRPDLYGDLTRPTEDF